MYVGPTYVSSEYKISGRKYDRTDQLWDRNGRTILILILIKYNDINFNLNKI
jgi:hypothetical protein